MKGAVSAQKALQGYETETRALLGGTEENSVSPTCFLFTKRKEKIIELVIRPGTEQSKRRPDNSKVSRMSIA